MSELVFQVTTLAPAEPLVSILTPTWNRAAYLERVWDALNKQTYRNIEWIVANDGSTDETVAVMQDLATRSDFPVLVINADMHIGKARMDNEAIARAQGEFILWNDSDDYLLPQAVEQLVLTWNSIPIADRKDYVGITTLCANEMGTILSELPFDGAFDTTWNDLRGKFKVSGDMLYFTRASTLKKNPFPEIDFVVPEGIVWVAIGNTKIRLQPIVLQVKQYRAPHCISFSNKMEYCRGRAYAIASIENNMKQYPKPLSAKLWNLITFIRCAIHGELSFRKTVGLWGGGKSTPFVVLLMSPIARLLAIKDVLQRKVIKTHREFDIAKNSVVINEMVNRDA